MKPITLLLLASVASMAADSDVDIYSASDLRAMAQKLEQKRTPFSSQNLKRYGNHYTMLAHREATGSSEVHEHEADIFIVESGDATIVTGGSLVNPHKEKEGEMRGTSISGGERHPLGPGDVVHIPAGIPHQLLIDKEKPFTYFVVKVAGQ